MVAHFQVSESGSKSNERVAHFIVDIHNDYLKHSADQLYDENRALRKEVKDFSLLRKVFGDQKIEEMIKVARTERIHRRKHEKNSVIMSR